MIQLTDTILYKYFRQRQKKIEAVISNPLHYQNALLKFILKSNQITEFGKNYDFKKINHREDYQNACPLQNYESLYPHIEKMMHNASNILVPGKVQWYAKSSGTSNARSKYIPVTKKSLNQGHLKCAWDAASHIYNEDPDAKLFANKSLIMGGSLEELDHNKKAGDISAIILHHFPKIGRGFYTPSFETALWPEWDEKIKRTAQETIHEKVTLLAGVPTWTLMLMREILKISGAEYITDIWPDLRSYLHGGVGFAPYRNEFRKLIPDQKVSFREVYNASEGYFAMQNHRDEDGMLLLCDHGIYYEFIPYNNIHESNPECLDISQVQKGQKYALVISTISGLYRYVIGDVIEFVTIRPYKIKVVGRVHDSINVFGEEVSAHNTDNAIGTVSDRHKAQVKDYTVAPVFIEDGKPGRHEWYIEFAKAPRNLARFTIDLDTELQNLNSDYAAKRSDDIAVVCLSIIVLPQGSFEQWLRSKNKYGGQSKIPRVKNDRQIADALIPYTY